MKNFFLISFFILAFSSGIFAQPNNSFEKVKTIVGNYTSFSVDNMGNIYLLSSTNQLKKLNANGDSVAVFNNIKRFGEATLADVSSPLKILLYYKNFATIVVLDGMLNQKNVIDLRKKNILNVNAIGLSYDGKIWLFDEVENTLKKIDDNGNTILKTADFRQLFDVTLSPQKIIDRNKLVYLYDTEKGIYVFDYYGSLKNKILITEWQNLQVADKYIFGNKGDRFYKYYIQSFKYDESPISPAFNGARQYFFENNFLYILNKNGLDLFSVK